MGQIKNKENKIKFATIINILLLLLLMENKLLNEIKYFAPVLKFFILPRLDINFSKECLLF